jgi:hypothetical protein
MAAAVPTGTVADLAAMISNCKGAKFASFLYRTKETNELQKIVIILKASTENLYEKDVVALEGMLSELTDALEIQACQFLIDSRKESLAKGIGNNAAYTCAGAYIEPQDIEGVKLLLSDGSLHVCGLLQHKTVIEPGVYKVVNSAPLTKAKNKLRASVPSSRFRQYRLDHVKSAKLNGEMLEIEI